MCSLRGRGRRGVSEAQGQGSPAGRQRSLQGEERACGGLGKWLRVKLEGPTYVCAPWAHGARVGGQRSPSKQGLREGCPVPARLLPPWCPTLHSSPRGRREPGGHSAISARAGRARGRVPPSSPASPPLSLWLRQVCPWPGPPEETREHSEQRDPGERGQPGPPRARGSPAGERLGLCSGLHDPEQLFGITKG